MHTVSWLVDLVGPNEVKDEEDASPARKLLATGTFAGCTTLLLLAIYQGSSTLVGPWVGPVSAFLAFGVGGLEVLRSEYEAFEAGEKS